jgi:hypothetical protein
MRLWVGLAFGLSAALTYGAFHAHADEVLCATRATGDDTGWVTAFHDTPGGLLLGAEKDLFRYDGTRTIKVQGDETGSVNGFHDTPGGLLLRAGRQLGLGYRLRAEHTFGRRPVI